jgi:hypothetical protein
MSGFQAILDAFARQGGGNPTLQDLAQNREGVQIPDKEGLKQAAMGVPSGMLGLPGDLESLGRSMFAENQETFLPTSEDIGQSMFGADTDSTDFQAGTFMSPDPFSKIMGAISAVAPIVTKLTKAPSIQAADFVPSKTKTGQNNFAQLQSEARQAMSPKDRAQVDPFNPEGFEGTTYMTPEGDAGFSMTDDGYIGHVFKHPGADKKGTISAVMTRARGDGGRSLDAVDTGLVDAYKGTGARETNRSGWNPDFASDEMIIGLGDQKPDYVGMDIGGMFEEQKYSEILGPRGQRNLPRSGTTPGGKPYKRPASVDVALDPANLDKIRGQIAKGIEMGGDKWYWQGQILDAFVKRYGEAQGLDEFDSAMDMSAIMSPLSDPMTEMRRASVIRNRLKQGLPVKDMDKSMFAPGYGHIATTTAHRSGLNRWLDEGVVGDPSAPLKTPSYSEALKGNYEPWVVDTHDIKSTFMGTPLEGKKNISAAELFYLEPELQSLGREFGLQGAEAQAAKWIGAGSDTGVMHLMNRIPMFNQRIAKTATELRISEEEAFNRWADGDVVLRSAIPVTLATGVGASMFDGGEEEESMF